MKYTVLLLFLFVLPASSLRAQYRPTGVNDTVEVYAQTSFANTPFSNVVVRMIYMVRNEVEFIGDKMDGGIPNRYAPHFESTYIFLDENKKPLPKDIIIWDYKLKTDIK